MQKGAFKYSNTCKPVKITAKTIVTNNPVCALDFAPATRAWCAQVTVAPDDKRITVFNKGTPQGLKVSKPYTQIKIQNKNSF